MAEKVLGPEFWIHGGGLDLVFPHHENERAQSHAAGRAFARIWMHNGMLRFTGEKMSKSLGNDATIREVLDAWGAETALLVLHDRALAQADRLLGGDDGGGARRRRRACATSLRGATDVASGSWRGRFAEVLEDDFNTPDALAVFHEWRRAETPTSLRRGLDVFGLGALGVERRARGASSRSPARGSPRERKDWAEADRLRDEIDGRRVGGARRRRAAVLPARAARVTRELVYGRNAVREALRGRREVLELWASERAAQTLEWLGERPRVHVKRERELTEAAGSPDHQGVVAWCEPYPYADGWELAAAEQPLLCCLDQVTDPRNLGAVVAQRGGCGSDRGDRAGARVARGDRSRVPLIGGRGRAPATGRRPESGPLSRRGEARRSLGVRRGRGRWHADVGDRPSGGVALVFGAEGKGVRPLVRRTCDAAVVDPARRRRGVAQRVGRSRRVAVRSPAAARCCGSGRGDGLPDGQTGFGHRSPWPSRRCTCSTGRTCSTRAVTPTGRSSSTGWRASWR